MSAPGPNTQSASPFSLRSLWILAGAGLVLIVGMGGILSALIALEREKIMEYEALADRLSRSAMTMLINEHYSNLQDLVDLLASMSSVQYIANYIGDEVGIRGGDPLNLEKELRQAKAATQSRILHTSAGRFLVVNNALPFNESIFSAPNTMQMVFALEPFFSRRNNLLIALGLILLLVILLGIAIALLQRVQRLLQSAEETKSHMISGLTHHAIKFLTVIQGQITKNEMRLRAGKELDPQELKKDFRVAAQNIEALNRLIENLNDHERLQKGGVKILSERLSLEDKIYEAAASLEDMARRRDIRIDVTPPVGDLTIASDAHVVQQALINVLENAVLYSRVQGRIRVLALADPQAVVVRVADEGPGLDPKDWERIFTPFVRLRPEIKGTGVGLSNARRLVRLLGGDLGVHESTLGQGTVFYLRFPRAVQRKEI